MTSRISLAQPDLGGHEEDYVLEAVRSTWISSTGQFIDKFESEFAHICGSKYALTVCNGTAALHLALAVLGVRPGDEIIVPALTYIATANAVSYLGATPVFVDIDRDNWCMAPELVKEAITPRTRGIIAVHIYGHPCDMDQLNNIAALHGLWLIEDAAEAPFAKYKGRPTGSLAKIGTFSFYGNKILTSGEGGAITLSEEELLVRARALRGQGMDPTRRYFFPIIGYNFRLTNIACAILCAQLERRVEMVKRRVEIYKRYESGLKDARGVALQPKSAWAEVAPWLFCVTIEQQECGIARDELLTKLATQGIETRPFFMPLHQLPPYRESARRRGVSCQISEALSARGANLPTFSTMTNEQVDQICDAIIQIVGR